MMQASCKCASPCLLHAFSQPIFAGLIKGVMLKAMFQGDP